MPNNETAENLAQKIQNLSPEQIAEVKDFVEFLRVRSQDRGLTRASAEVGAPAFAAVWSNPEDDDYDDILINLIINF
jgi:hypothetical protein